jgi:hypothetical protein
MQKTLDKQQTFDRLVMVYGMRFDNRISEAQLVKAIGEIEKQTKLTFREFAELNLDAQWHNATEADYQEKREQLAKEWVDGMGMVVERVYRCRFFWRYDEEGTLNNWSFPNEQAFNVWYEEMKNSIEIFDAKYVDEEMEF